MRRVKLRPQMWLTRLGKNEEKLMYKNFLFHAARDRQSSRATTSRENVIRKYLNFPHTFFKFQWDYDLNLGRYLNPELPPMRDFGSLIRGKYPDKKSFISGNKFVHTKVQRFKKYRDPKLRIGGNSGFKYRRKFRS